MPCLLSCLSPPPLPPLPICLVRTHPIRSLANPPWDHSCSTFHLPFTPSPSLHHSPIAFIRRDETSRSTISSLKKELAELRQAYAATHEQQKMERLQQQVPLHYHQEQEQQDDPLWGVQHDVAHRLSQRRDVALQATSTAAPLCPMTSHLSSRTYHFSMR